MCWKAGTAADRSVAGQRHVPITLATRSVTRAPAFTRRILTSRLRPVGSPPAWSSTPTRSAFAPSARTKRPKSRRTRPTSAKRSTPPAIKKSAPMTAHARASLNAQRSMTPLDRSLRWSGRPPNRWPSWPRPTAFPSPPPSAGSGRPAAGASCRPAAPVSRADSILPGRWVAKQSVHERVTAATQSPRAVLRWGEPGSLVGARTLRARSRP